MLKRLLFVLIGIILFVCLLVPGYILLAFLIARAPLLWILYGPNEWMDKAMLWNPPYEIFFRYIEWADKKGGEN